MTTFPVSPSLAHEDSSVDAKLLRAPRIAVLAPLAWRTPPRGYGPWELFASLLTESLVELGHDVTLFATGDSVTSAKLHSTLPHGWSEDTTVDPKVAECLHIASVFEQADDFDIIHNGFDFLPLTYSRLVRTPVVTTVHGFSSPAIKRVYKRYNATSHFVAISDSDREPNLTYDATIHHGIDTDDFRLHPDPGQHLLFFGRIHPDKGPDVAIRVAREAGRRLIIAGLIQDEQYFEEKVRPHIDGDMVRFVGMVSAEDKAEVLGHAFALLHLIGFDEPFGFSVVEAMACGTPVVAYAKGSMAEIIDDGVTGFLVNDVASAVRALGQVDGLNRPRIRERTIQRFHRMSMARRYSDLYGRVLSGLPTEVGRDRLMV